MYLDLNNRYPQWEPSQPPPKPEKRLTPRREKILLIVVCLYLALTLMAPIGGSSIIQAFIR
jgi:hypothetical protein